MKASTFCAGGSIATSIASCANPEDSLGNIVHTLSYARPIERIGVTAEGEIETFDTAGIVRGAVEPLAPDIYLRASPRAEANGALREFAEDAARDGDAILDKLHALMTAIYETMTHDTELTRAPTLAAEAFALRRGAAQDFAHIFIACARWLGAPARYVSGFLVRGDGDAEESGHAWAEAYLPVIGWIGFDCCNSICVDENYVRVAIGFDHLSAAPTRGTRRQGRRRRRDDQKRVEDRPGRRASATELKRRASADRRRAPSPTLEATMSVKRTVASTVSISTGLSRR